MKLNNEFNIDLSNCLHGLNRICNDMESFKPTANQLASNVEVSAKDNWESYVTFIDNLLNKLLMVAEYIEGNDNMQSFLQLLKFNTKFIKQEGYYSDKKEKYFERILDDRAFYKMTHISF